MKKLVSIVLALAMVLMVGSALATATIYSGAYTPDGSNTLWTTGSTGGSITVNLPQDSAGNYPAGSNTFRIYKVFDGTNDGTANAIAYTSRQGATLPATGETNVFFADDAGNIHYGTYTTWTDSDTGAYYYVGGNKVKVTNATALSPAAITAIKNYVRSTDLIATAVTASGDSSFTVSGLAYGYYFVDTTLGSVVAIDSANPSATITDKWDIPNIDKTVKEDSNNEYQKQNDAEVGQSVEFKVIIHAKPGAKGYVLHDKMTAGLTFNKDVNIYVGSSTTPAVTFSDYGTQSGNVLAAGGEYKSSATATAETGTFTLTFADTWLNTNVGSSNVDITVTYTATINSNAVVNTPDQNDTVLTYGNNNYTNESETKTYVWGIDVTKQDGASSAKLAGAKFVIYKAGATTGTIQTALFDASGKLTGWSSAITATDTQLLTKTLSDFNSASILTTAETTGKIIVTGMDEGTYKLLEVEAPAGYNKMTDVVDVSIDSTSDTNTGKSLTNALTAETDGYKVVSVNNYKGTELPSTGGIGTTIFYILGGLLVVGAAVILVARRKASN